MSNKAHIIYLNDTSVSGIAALKYLGTFPNDTELFNYTPLTSGNIGAVINSASHGNKAATMLWDGSAWRTLSSEEALSLLTQLAAGSYSKIQIDAMFASLGWRTPVANVAALADITDPQAGQNVLVLSAAAGKHAIYSYVGGAWSLTTSADWGTKLTQISQQIVTLSGQIGGAGYWGVPVANMTELNALVNPGTGEMRLVLSAEPIPYRYTGTTWVRHYAIPTCAKESDLTAFTASVIANNITNAIVLVRDAKSLFWYSFTENKWVSIGGGGGSAASGAAIFITDVAVGGGSLLTKNYSAGTIGKQIVSDLLSDTRDMTVYVEWDGSAEHWNGTLKLNGVAVTNGVRIGDTRRFAGSLAITVPSAGEFTNKIVASHSSGSKITVPVTMAADAPNILTLTVSGPYPTTNGVLQTALKENDVIQISGTTNIAAGKIEIMDFGAFKNTLTVVSGTAFSIMATVANRGNVPTLFAFKARAVSPEGSNGPVFTSSATLNLDNGRPSLVYNAINYPATQGALKNAEQASIDYTITGGNSVIFSSPNSQLSLISGETIAGPMVVGRIAGNYNVNTNNLNVRVHKNSNGSYADFPTVVKIAHTAPVVSLSVPAARLRSGSTFGSAVQTHVVTLTSSQVLAAIPVITADKGTLQATMAVATPTTYSQGLAVDDTTPKGAGTFALTSAVNLAGIPAAGLSAGSAYTIGGFVSRQITMAAYQSIIPVGTTITDNSKLLVTYVSTPLTYEAGAAPSGQFKFCVEAPDKIIVHSGMYLQNASGTAILTVEETI